MDSRDAEMLSITLPAEMARIICEKVASGAYGSNSEVIRDAQRGWLERDRRLTALDAAVATGLAVAGRVQPINEVRTDLRGRLGKKSRTPA